MTSLTPVKARQMVDATASDATDTIRDSHPSAPRRRFHETPAARVMALVSNAPAASHIH
ncbi:hypothetical protein E4U59_006284, partial [Claviceps monticola]